MPRWLASGRWGSRRGRPLHTRLPVIGATLSKASQTMAMRKTFGMPSLTEVASACRSRISTKTALDANVCSSAAKWVSHWASREDVSTESRMLA